MIRQLGLQLLCVLGMTSWAGAQEHAQDAADVLAFAGDVGRLRSLLIAEHVAWVNEAVAAPPEAIPAYRKKYVTAMQRYLKTVATPSVRDDLERVYSATAENATRTGLVDAAFGPLPGLPRPLIPEWVVSLAAMSEQLVAGRADGDGNDSVEVLMRQVGRPASIAIVKRLRTQPNMAPFKRERLLAMLRAVEGRASDTLLELVTLPEVADESVPGPMKDGQHVAFKLVPTLGAVDPESRPRRAVMNFETRSLVADPSYSAEDWATEESIESMLMRQRKLGDLAFSEDGTPVVASAKCEELSSPLWFGAIPRLKVGEDARQEQPVYVQDDRMLLLEASNGSIVVVQMLGATYNQEIALAYVVIVPVRGQSIAAIQSDLSFVLGAKDERDFGEIVARQQYIEMRASSYLESVRICAQSLRQLLENGSNAGERQRVEAARFLGELRSFESAGTLIALIAGEEPEAIQAAAADALERMTPHARDAFRTQIKAAEGPSRERLLKVFRRLEGDEVAEFLLDLWAKEDAK